MFQRIIVRVAAAMNALAGVGVEPVLVADEFGAEFKCDAPEHKLAAPTRKAMMLLFARAAAGRLQSLIDPAGPYGEMG